MKPICSFRVICKGYGLNLPQTHTIQSLIRQRKGILHPYWIQLALYMPYDFAKRLHDELVANEWAIPDRTDINGTTYESILTSTEVEVLAQIELTTSNYFS